MFIVIWQYAVNAMCKKDFEELYGPNGKWVKLFQSAAGYVNIQLIKAVIESNHYATIDTWTSQEYYEKFLTEYKTPFAEIDAAGEQFTLSETKIGWFKDVKNMITT